jgi:glycosyltransferase involved in cell wall biosynthesis
MKILILFSHSWRGGRSGGAETHAQKLMKELSLRGHEIYFVASGEQSEDEPRPPGVVAEYRLPFQSLNPWDKITAYRQLRKIVERHGIEIIHAHHRTGGYFAESIRRRTGVPYVLTVHDIWHRAPAKGLHGSIFRHLIAVSGFIKKGLVERFGMKPEQVRVIHNGVDPKPFERASDEQAGLFRKEFGIRENEVVFSLVARITESKGHYDVVEALRGLPQDLPYRLLIVGEGKDRRKLERLVAGYGVSGKVVFCGFQGEIPVLMRASDVILLPSHREPFGQSIVEGMLSGRAVLASDAGGIPEIVSHGVDGWLFAVKDTAALAKGMEALTRDEGLRQRLGEQAYRTAHERFLLTRMIDDTEAYYKWIVGLGRAQGAGTAVE